MGAARTYKSMKNQIPLDSPGLQAPITALQAFFEEMNRWERSAEQRGRGDQADIDDLFSRRVSLSPRPGWRPVHHFLETWRNLYRAPPDCGRAGHKNKCWIYAENGIFYYRFLLRLTEGRWMIDNAQQCREGRWVFCGL